MRALGSGCSASWTWSIPNTRCRALKGNRRLADRWTAFEKRGKLPVKANSAVAREPTGWCWSLAAPLQGPPPANAGAQSLAEDETMPRAGG